MTREDLVDACVYGCVNANPSITVRGASWAWPGFTQLEIKASLERLAEAGMVAPNATGACSVFEVQWSVVKAP